MQHQHRRRHLVCGAAVLVALSGCGDTTNNPPEEPRADITVPGDGTASAAPDLSGGLSSTLLDPQGEELGTVGMTLLDDGVQIQVEATGMPPGFHGFHVHTTGVCEADSTSPTDPTQVGDFLSAGGHLGAAEAAHAEHDGDLTSLYVAADGTGTLTTLSDRLTEDALLDEDGSAVMVHAGPDDFGNVPERYAPAGPDAETDATGDSGGRIACGVVEGTG